MSVFIIAEVGPNHNGSMDLAKKLTKELCDLDVDAIKFQMGDPSQTLSLDAFKASYQKANDNAVDVLEASRKRQLSREEHAELSAYCRTRGKEYLCTAFDLESLRFLHEELAVPRIKISSGEIFSVDMMEYIRHQYKPVIMSTGMATYDEIDKAVALLESDQCKQNLTLLHCVSNYPAPIEDVNLRCMLELRARYKVSVGYSDHTLGVEAALAAVALGACVIEKHVTLDKSLPGPDHAASSSVEEFSDLIHSIRKVEACLGGKEKIFSPAEQEIVRVARKSIVAKRVLNPGETITPDDICFRRPGTGYLPIDQENVIGRIVAVRVEENRVIKPEHLA